MAPPAQTQTGFGQLSAGVKILLLFLMLGVASAVYYFAFHMSRAEEIDNAQQRYVQLQAQLRQEQERQQEYLRLTQELAAREAIDRENKRILPEEAEIAAFLQDLNRLAELSGLSIMLVEPRPEEQAEMYIRIPVTVQLEGQYHQLAKFFYNITKLERAVNMENVELAQPTTDAENVKLRIAVLATTFRRPMESQGGAPGQGAPAAPGAGGAH